MQQYCFFADFIMWSLRGASGQPAQQPQDDHPGSPPGIDVEVPAVENRLPTPEVPQTATPLPQTPRRRRRFVQAVLSPSRRRTRMQTQSELARQAFVNSDNEWRVFQRQCEEERLRLRERELNQQERWLELFAQMIALGNRIADTLK